ncbi:PREDICTED: L-galactose dehydrogenase-like [Papilio xuthus]|uniref:L-galactose dehydrogenase-like n=1 Tax=Papilio xuthus TaxID=66420 RepID=A0AAJ6ZU02_PAPXU|nr:PREDICTED: L-galactose dehydrogenase-like [Papilio xuthus]
MRYNELGDTGMKVSHIGLGGAAFSNIYGTYDEKRSFELIRESLNRGVNYLETGPWYGQGSSERTIGKALKHVPRSSFFIGSKVGRYEKEPEKMFDFSAEKTEAGMDNTLALLGLDYVDLIQVSVQRQFKRISSRHILIFNVSIKQVFQSKRVGVINAAATGMGLLSNKGPQPWHPASDDVKAICKRASDYCKSKNVELARIASWFTLNQPGIDVNICGFFNVEQMVDTLEILDSGLSEHEKIVLSEIQTRFFDKVTLHWDDVELPAYKAELDKVINK